MKLTEEKKQEQKEGERVDLGNASMWAEDLCPGKGSQKKEREMLQRSTQNKMMEGGIMFQVGVSPQLKVQKGKGSSVRTEKTPRTCH